MPKIKLLAVAAPLAFSLNANALVLDLGNVTPTPGGTFFSHDFVTSQSYLGTGASAGIYHDSFAFNLLGDAYVTFTAGASAFAGLLNDGATTYSFISGDFTAPVNFTKWLAAGNYQVDFKSTTGAFTGTLNAVPEPETYALMLAGLALVGFSARRRQA